MSLSAYLGGAAALFVFASPALSAPVEWAVADGGNGHFYEFVAHDAMGWADARAAALAVGGYLATVTSAEEMAFIAALNTSGGFAFLGGSDAAVEGTWRWADGPEAGQAFTLAPWSPGEPNNLGGEHYLMAYSNGLWNDVPASYQISYSFVEFDSLGAQVPLPAAAPLLLVGLGAIGAAARRRRG